LPAHPRLNSRHPGAGARRKGVVIAGDIKIKLVEIELLTIKIRQIG
jgi:hypothetical protein